MEDHSVVGEASGAVSNLCRGGSSTTNTGPSSHDWIFRVVEIPMVSPYATCALRAGEAEEAEIDADHSIRLGVTRLSKGQSQTPGRRQCGVVGVVGFGGPWED